jgi:hypothetical protein
MKNKFNKNRYTIIKKALDKHTTEFIYNYFMIKRQVYDTFLQHNYLSPFTTDWGTYTDKQVPNTYSHYSDIAMETLLLKLQPVMEKHVGLNLIPTYSYARIYKKGDILKRHKDRASCEISTTLNLGGDPWPIFVDPTGSDNIIDEDKNIHKPNAPKGRKYLLKPGDMFIYRGCELEHWRESFGGENCVQVFLHYNHANGSFAKDNLFDGRIHIGLPNWFKQNK